MVSPLCERTGNAEDTHLDLGVRLQTEPLWDWPTFASRLRSCPRPKPPSYISPVLAGGLGERAFRAERLLGRLRINRRKQPSSGFNNLAGRGVVPWPTCLFVWDVDGVDP